jgi:hypothetical protein
VGKHFGVVDPLEFKVQSEKCKIQSEEGLRPLDAAATAPPFDPAAHPSLSQSYHFAL